MGDAWIVHGLMWKIVIVLCRNAHLGVLITKSNTFPLRVYYHSNRSKSTGGLEELVLYYCGNLNFHLAVNDNY